MGIKSRTQGGACVRQAPGRTASEKTSKKRRFLRVFFGGKLRPRRDAWAGACGYARPHTQADP